MLLQKIHLEPGESIVRIVRKHWFVLAAELASLAVLLLIPPTFYVLFHYVPDNSVFTAQDFVSHFGEFLFLSAAWYLMVVVAAALIWTHYYLDMWIITNQRVIVVDQVRLFNRHIGTFRLERLQDMNIEISGLLATFLNFGTISAQTASADEFRGTGMPDPRGLKALIQTQAEHLPPAPANTQNDV